MIPKGLTSRNIPRKDMARLEEAQYVVKGMGLRGAHDESNRFSLQTFTEPHKMNRQFENEQEKAIIAKGKKPTLRKILFDELVDITAVHLIEENNGLI